jgi:hypothetical protein
VRNVIDRVNWVTLFVVLEVIVSALVSFFIVPIIDSESIWGYIVVGLIIFVNTFVFLGVLFALYYKEVRSGVATSLIVKICAIFLIIFIVGTAIIIFLGQIS